MKTLTDQSQPRMVEPSQERKRSDPARLDRA